MFDNPKKRLEHDERWMGLARHIANWSIDQSRRTSAVIVDQDDILVNIGINQFPDGVDDTLACRHERPAKYLYTEHAENNAIYNAARKGVSTANCRIYLPWYPCAGCARAIIKSGIKEVIGVQPDWNDPKWRDDFEAARTMLLEANVRVRFMDGEAPATSKPFDKVA